MLTQKSNMFQNRNISIILAVVTLGLVAGIYFLFNPFPAGSSLQVVANVQNRPGSTASRTDMGWNALANPPRVVTAQAIQKVDLGAGYMLETGSQGTRIVAPSVASAVPSSTKRFDIGGGYMLETGSLGTRIVAPSVASAVASSVKRFDIGGGYMLETGSQGTRIVAPSVASAVASSVKRFDIGGGYMLETGLQGTRLIAPSTP